MSESNGNNGNGNNGHARPARARAAEAVGALRESDLPELYRFWSGQKQGRIPDDRELLRRQVLEWMSDARIVSERVGALGKRLQAVLEHHLDAPRYQCSFPELVNARALSYLSSYDLEATLLALQRHALVVESRMLKASGTSLASTDYQQDQVANFIVRAGSYDEVLARAAQARHGLRINGVPLGANVNNVVVLR